MIILRYTPKGARKLKHYAFVVITGTPADYRPPVSPSHGFTERYAKGQILICQMLGDTGGIPIEVGTDIKPGKLNFTYEPFDVMAQAIEFSYQITDSGFGHRKQGKQKNTWHGKRAKKTRKVRHQA